MFKPLVAEGARIGGQVGKMFYRQALQIQFQQDVIVGDEIKRKVEMHADFEHSESGVAGGVNHGAARRIPAAAIKPRALARQIGKGRQARSEACIRRRCRD